MIEYILFFVGIAFLLKGADFLVDGASSLAKRAGVSTLVIGLTIVAFGTSMPELVVNVLAALAGNSEIAFGNIVGSNIANILLILGVTASITSLKVQRSTTWKEIPFSLLAALVLLVFSIVFITDKFVLDSIFRFEGIILLLFFTIFLYYIIEMAKKDRANKKKEDLEIKTLPYSKSAFFILIGLFGLYLGGKWVVDGAVTFAQFLGVSDYFISLTIIALGTSLPELVTSIKAALKRDIDMAVGNVVGSNIFNIFWILGITAIINPIKIPASALFDLVFLLAISFVFFMFMFIGKRHELERWQGFSFVIMYVAYISYLIIRS